MQSKEIWIIIGTALLSAVGNGIYLGSLQGMVEGLSIICTCIAMLIFQSIADYIKDSRFIHLQGLTKEENVPVIRGKFGLTQSVSIWDLVAGDVVLLSSGSKVPADCLVINSFDLQVEDGDADDDHLEDEQRRE